MSTDAADGMDALLARLAARGPPAIVSALAWSGAMAAAVAEMALTGEPRAEAARARRELASLGWRDAEAYGRFLVSEGGDRLELLREATRVPLEISGCARRARDVVRESLAVDSPLAADLEGAIHLLETVAVRAAAVALVNARSGGMPLADLETKATRILEQLRTTSARGYPGSWEAE